MRQHVLIGLCALVAGCGEVTPQLHKDRNADGTTYLAPWCQNREELRALKVPVLKVPRDTPILKDNNAAGVWIFGVILIRDDLRGWVAQDVEDHERCHELTNRRTGSPVFHR